MLDLSSVNALIKTGDDQLRALNQQVVDWKDNEPYSILKECNVERTDYNVGIRFDNWPDLYRWAGIARNAINNYRCALDHFANALGVHYGFAPGPNDDALTWPICDTKRRFDGALNQLGGMHKKIRGLRAAVQSTQPFAGPDHEDFFILRRTRDIDNPGKHRELQLSAFGLQRVDAIFGPLEAGTYDVTINEGPLEREAPLIRLQLAKPNPNVTMNLNFSIRIAFADEPAPPKAMLEVISESRQAVLGVLRVVRERLGLTD